MTHRLFHRSWLLMCVIVISSCTNQQTALIPTQSPTIPSTNTPEPSATPIPTNTPAPTDPLDIGIESKTIQANVLAYLLNDHPTYADSLFHAAAHPGLFKLDAVSGGYSPAIATSLFQGWEDVNNNLELIVDIVPGLKWSDGSSLTSDDILFSFNLIQKLAAIQADSNHHIILEFSLEIISPQQFKFTTSAVSISESASYAMLTFPIMQKGFWENHSNDFFNSHDAFNMNELSTQFDQLTTERYQLEREKNTLQEKIKDTRIALNIKQSSLGENLKFVHDKKTPANRNGVKDGESTVRALRMIASLQDEISILDDTLEDQLSKANETEIQLDRLLTRQQDLLTQWIDIFDTISRSLLEFDLADEPLLLPYRIQAFSMNQVDMRAIDGSVTKPDLISFHAFGNPDLIQKYEQGSLDAIFTRMSNLVISEALPARSSKYPCNID